MSGPVTKLPEVEGFNLVFPIEVRWRDVDSMRHVNNAVYFTYYEMARTEYWERVFGAYDVDQIDFMVAAAHCNYKMEVSRGIPLACCVRISRLGNTSFDFEYMIVRADDGRTVSSGYTTQVLYDHPNKVKKPLTPEWVAKVEAFEGRSIPRNPSP